MKSIITFAYLMLALCCASAALAAPKYRIATLGLDDLEHTRNDGFKYSSALQLNEAGQVIGAAERYNGGGYSAWFYNGTTTINIGLTDDEHTHFSGARQSHALELNESGQVRGWSVRMNDCCTGFGADWGQSAWLYDGSTTINIGLTGPEYTRNDGYKDSRGYQLNEAGQVTGRSTRYDGGNAATGGRTWLYNGATWIDIGFAGSAYYSGSNLPYELNETGQVSGTAALISGGLSAWLYDGTTTIDIGLTGSEYTSSDGYKYSTVIDLNEAGRVIGYSERYNGDTGLGVSAWLSDGATTIDIGLTGSEYTSSSGSKNSEPSALNEAGQVRGYSYRYNGGDTELGLSAWLYDGATTINIGLAGIEHTRNDGYKYSLSQELNEAGQVRGYSYRYNGGCCDVLGLGRSAWLYNGSTTIHLGLTGPEHTALDGFKDSFTTQMNEAGQVIGYSDRNNGGVANLGRSAWFYDGATTIHIGLTGTEHTRNNDYKFSDAQQLNEAGQVIGVSYRYNGGSTQLGQDAWFHDPLLDQTFVLNLSTRSDGFAFSSVDYLGEDGLVLGTYTLFDASDNYLGDRAFYFTVADGLHDLGSLVEGGLSANGWDYLGNVVYLESGFHWNEDFEVNSRGQILGHGKLSSQSGGRMAYLLTPVVPEPGALVLAMLGIMGLLSRRRVFGKSRTVGQLSRPVETG